MKNPESKLNRRSFLRMGAGMAFAVPLAACTVQDPLAEQAKAGDNKNYIAGDGSVSEYAPDSRGEPVTMDAPLFGGGRIRSADFVGQVTVLNFWYAACSPCRVEAPDLEALHQEFSPKGAKFYGINIRDEKPTAEAFERNFGISYPSVDDKDGSVLLSLTRFVPPQAVPTTLVLDRKGRVAARILGLAEKSTLRALIADTLAEGPETA